MAVDKIDVALVSGVVEKEPQLYEILKKTVEKVNGVVEQTNTDITVAAASGPSEPAGVIKMFGGFKAPGGWLFCDGTSYKRTDQQALYDAITIKFFGVVTAASNTITSVGAATVGCSVGPPVKMVFRAGMPIQGFGIPSGTTITNAAFAGTMNELLTITMSAVATASSPEGQSELRVFPFGVPAGATELTHFYVPNLQERFPLGAEDGAFGAGHALGESGGTWDHTHTGGSHTHTVAAHGHTLSAHTHTGPSHTHDLANHTHTGPSHTHDIAHDHTVTALDWRTEVESQSPTEVQSGTGVEVATKDHYHTLPYTNETVSGAGLTSGAGGTGATGTPSSNTSGASGTGVTGAPSTDATSNTSLTTDAGGAVATTAANPPYVVVNFIIKT